MRRRADDRSVVDEGHPGRSGGAHGLGAARTVMAGIRPREAKMLHEGVTVLVAVKQHETALDAASGDYGVDGLAHRNSQIGALLGVGGKIREC